jgi:hypothetical protein
MHERYTLVPALLTLLGSHVLQGRGLLTIDVAAIPRGAALWVVTIVIRCVTLARAVSADFATAPWQSFWRAQRPSFRTTLNRSTTPFGHSPPSPG